MRLFLEIAGKGLYKFLTNPNYREYLRLAFIYGDKERYCKHKIRFLDVEFEVPDCRSFIPQFKDIFVEEDYKFRTDRNQHLIYDCGANIGMSLLYFKKLYPGAIIRAFEADPNIAEILTLNMNRNRISGVDVISKAVWINNDGVGISKEGADAASIFSNRQKVMIDSIRL